MGDKQDQGVGTGKEVVGKATGNRRTEAEGKAQRAAGRAKEAMRDAADTAKGAAEGVRQAAGRRRK